MSNNIKSFEINEFLDINDKIVKNFENFKINVNKNYDVVKDVIVCNEFRVTGLNQN